MTKPDKNTTLTGRIQSMILALHPTSEWIIPNFTPNRVQNSSRKGKQSMALPSKPKELSWERKKKKENTSRKFYIEHIHTESLKYLSIKNCWHDYRHMEITGLCWEMYVAKSTANLD